MDDVPLEERTFFGLRLLDQPNIESQHLRVDLKTMNLRCRHLRRASTSIDAVLQLPSMPFKGRCEVDQPTSTPFEGATPLDRSGTAASGGLAGGRARAVTTLLLWIDGSPARGDPRGYTVTGTVQPPPTDSRGESDVRSGLWTRSSFDIEPEAEKRESLSVRV